MLDINKVQVGLDLDSSPENVKKGSYPFALNSVLETNKGDIGNVSNERGNDLYLNLPQEYKLIGSEYIGGGETVVFLTNPTLNLDQIGIIYGNKEYEFFIEANLNFNIQKQIDCVFRLRRGCERVVYFCDGLNKTRSFNFDNLSLYKDEDNNWVPSLLNLTKTPSSLLKIEDVEIITGLGQIPIGSYSFGFIYLDDNLNESEIINYTDPVKIYNSSYIRPYIDIVGSLPTADQPEYNTTNKGVQITFSNIDTNYPYYKIVLFKYTNGDGKLTSVEYTDVISTSENIFNYTGEEGVTSSVIEDATRKQSRYSSAEHIEQLENILVQGNLKNKDVNYCDFQKFASKIEVNAVTKTIDFNNINEKNNPRRGEINVEGTGYLPGEMYSIGIEYVFEDGDVTPVFHIPGKSESSATNMGDNNISFSNKYLESSECEKNRLSYWGNDSTGEPLKNQLVRHHRIPERAELGSSLVNRVDSNVYAPGTTFDLEIDIRDSFLVGETVENYTIRVSWEEDLIPSEFSFNLNVSDYTLNENSAFSVATGLTGDLTNIVIEISDASLGVPSWEVVNENSSPSYVVNEIPQVGAIVTEVEDTFNGDIIGLNLSNIDLPEGEFLNGNKIVGYRIVRQKRTEKDSSIVDSAVMLPLTEDSKEVSFSVVSPSSKICPDAFALVIPKYLFLEQELSSFTDIVRTGKFNSNFLNGNFGIQDIVDGTSANEDTKKKDSDSDGFSLKSNIHLTILDHITETTSLITNDIKEIKYLKPLDIVYFKDSDGDINTLYNLSHDNKIAIVTLNSKLSEEIQEELKTSPITVNLCKKVLNPYSNFRTTYFEKEHTNVETSPTLEIFNGDVYTSPMKYFTTSLYRIYVKQREQKSGAGKIIAGSVIAAVGATVAVISAIFVFPPGISAGVALTRAGTLVLKNGIDANKRKRAYDKAYEDNIPPRSINGTTRMSFPDEEDDEVQYYSGILEDLWFESQVNMHHRFNFEDVQTEITSFLPSPGGIDFSNYADYSLRKLTKIDASRSAGRAERVETPLELTSINEDYVNSPNINLSYPLSTTYSCCSDCNESFPNRIIWSEQSFQEELSDNYSVFKPNNYKDIEGYSGEITDLFKVSTNLYVHTAEALWHLPQNLQERVTDDIVSFIGTGEYFNIPPRLILDSSNGMSAGCSHKWGTLKTNYGVFFVSEYLGIVYQFDGKSLTPLTSKNIYNWSKDNFKLLSNKQYNELNGKKYPYFNNTVGSLGSGFISVYDSRLERIIFTKKDYSLSSLLEEGPTEICTKDGINYFKSVGLTDIISTEALSGWEYIGIENCELQFQKIIEENFQEVIEYKSLPMVSVEADVLNNSFTLSYNLKTQSWASFHSYLPNWYFYTPDKFYSYISETNQVWKHNSDLLYNNYYGVIKPFIIESVSVSDKVKTKIWDYLQFSTKAYQKENNTTKELRFTTFDKALFYNSRQCSGIVNLKVKDIGVDEDYLFEQVNNIANDEIIVDRNEKDWSLNEMRDIVEDYDQTIFNKDLAALQANYFIDKVLNPSALNVDKDWTELESFRDKYLVVRFIFDKFDNINLTLNFSIEDSEESLR